MRLSLVLAAFVLTAMPLCAAAGDLYVTAGGGMANALNGESVGGMTAGQDEDGAALSLSTRYDGGFFAFSGYGKRSAYGPFRSELELSYSSVGVDKHVRPSRGDVVLDDAPASSLLGAGAGNLPLAQFLAQDEGEVQATTLMVNAFWDIPVGDNQLAPYIGLGVGASFIDAEFAPSGVSILDGEDWVFAYQAMLGVQMKATENLLIRGGFRYRGTGDVEIGSPLPALAEGLEIDMKQTMFEIGLRRNF
ncbi:MAG: P44/Msp2 family outer membrane protein [Parvularcula sp.]|jgi:opacity protein-like surface antigen|nr:P44/Msp2 family outer membrane protein [Parvularcula sp.]